MKCPFCGAEMREGYVEVAGRGGVHGAAPLAFHDAGDEKLPVFAQLEKQVPLVKFQFNNVWYTLPASRCDACKETILHGA